MNLLLDECIDRRLAKEFLGHYVRTVPQMGWSGLTNGHLLQVAQTKFDVFITVDRNLSSQQSLVKYDIAVLVMRARTNQLVHLKPLVPKLLKALPLSRKGHAVFVSS